MKFHDNSFRGKQLCAGNHFSNLCIVTLTFDPPNLQGTSLTHGESACDVS